MRLESGSQRIAVASALTAAVLAGVVWSLPGLTPRARTASDAHSHLHAMEARPEVAGEGLRSRPATTLKTIACEPLRDMPGKVLVTTVVHFPPHAYTPAHRHPGVLQAYVLSGSVRSQLDGLPPRSYTAGEAWFEPKGVLHLFAENPADAPAEVLATFITAEDCNELIRF